MEVDAQNKAISPTLDNSITTTSASAMSDPVIDYRSGSKDPAGRTAYSGDPITRPLRERLRSNRQSDVVVATVSADVDQFEPAKCGGHGHSGPPSHFGAAKAEHAKAKPQRRVSRIRVSSKGVANPDSNNE